VTLTFLVQHAQKKPDAGDPELTALGHDQAARTARWLSRLGLTAVYSSPQRRARQTAEAIAAATGLEVRLDDRLRERMNWDGRSPLSDFLAEWDRSTRDRDFVPRGGESSHQAAARLREFLVERIGEPGPVAVVSHGGVTVDLLRSLLGDAGLPDQLIAEGVPPCAITTFDALNVVGIARTGHLHEEATG